MAEKACKCRKPAECQECECPEWIFTFADLVMLMMGFFVILWVLKPEEKNKSNGQPSDYIINIEAKVRGGFGYVPDPHSNDPVDKQMILDGMSRLRPPGQGHTGHTENQPNGPNGADALVTSIRPSKHATEGGKMLFARGSTALTDQTKGELAQVADLVRGHRNIVMVKGHTSLDDLPDGATAQQKMDLSFRRAQAAVDYLVSQGVDAEILRAQGCSIYEPLSQRQYSVESQDLNRRVEVEATATLEDDMDNSKPASTPAASPAVSPPNQTPAKGN